MRPDEHKRKRSAQYKKKHGMSKGKETDKETKQSKETNNSGSDRTLNESDKGDKKTDKIPAEDTDTSTSKIFHRRQIESNWSRYDDLPPLTEEIPTQKGDNFQKLLDAAGGSLSQFRLKDEQDWSKDELVTDTANPTGFLSIDFDGISSALTCVPLHQRLGLSESLFSDTQLTEINSIANQNSSSYNSTVQYQCPPAETSQSSTPRVQDTALSDLDCLLLDTKSEKHHVTKEKCIVSVTDDLQIAKQPAEISSSQPAVVKTSVVVDNAELEDQLDFLLGIDKPDKTSVKTNLNVEDGETVVKATETSPDNHLPLLHKKDVTKPLRSSVAVDNTGDLDWLDSVLDS